MFFFQSRCECAKCLFSRLSHLGWNHFFLAFTEIIEHGNSATSCEEEPQAMLSGKLISNRKERSSTYQLFTQGSCGLFRFALANIFKCSPLPGMKYTAPCHSHRGPWLLGELSMQKIPFTSKVAGCGLHPLLDQHSQELWRENQEPQTSHSDVQPELVLFQAVLPNWWQLAGQQCQTFGNWVLHRTGIYRVQQRGQAYLSVVGRVIIWV